MPGAFKLDHLQPIEPLLFQKIFNFFTFLLGGQFLLPQRANSVKGAERPDTGHYRKASVLPWARKQVSSGFLAQGSAEAFL